MVYMSFTIAISEVDAYHVVTYFMSNVRILVYCASQFSCIYILEIEPERAKQRRCFGCMSWRPSCFYPKSTTGPQA
jgi:hypothetical protein